MTLSKVLKEQNKQTMSLFKKKHCTQNFMVNASHLIIICHKLCVVEKYIYIYK